MANKNVTSGTTASNDALSRKVRDASSSARGDSSRDKTASTSAYKEESARKSNPAEETIRKAASRDTDYSKPSPVGMYRKGGKIRKKKSRAKSRA
jgi:hypothetical protein